jgi:hypothetical protein
MLPPVFVRLARPHVEKVEELGRRILVDEVSRRNSSFNGNLPFGVTAKDIILEIS